MVVRNLPPSSGGAPTVSPVFGPDTPHMSLLDVLPQWERIAAVLKGSDGVKSIAQQILPMSAYDKRHPEYYQAYVERANFVNYTLRTVDAMQGLIYRKDPNIKVPSSFEERLKNINNAGDDVITFCKKITHNVICYGRVGILVDYTPSSDRSSRQTPFLTMWTANNIINWRQKTGDGETVLSQVVLRSFYEEVQEFGSITRTQYLVLDLDEEGYYRVRIFKRRESGEFYLDQQIYPGREKLRKIPFIFINPTDLSPDVHRPPILDLVDINIAHLRTSACYETALWLCSQPTVAITGLDPDDSNKFEVGTVWKLPQGTDVKYLEMTADGLAGMERALAAKEEQMREIGAQMLSSTSNGPETAAAARIRQHSQTSVLSSIAGTSSSGIQAAMQLACDVDKIPGKVNVELNQDFIESTIDPQMFLALCKARDMNLITDEDYVYCCIRGELTRPGVTAEEIIGALQTQKPIFQGTPDLAVAALPTTRRAAAAKLAVDAAETPPKVRVRAGRGENRE